MSGEYKNQSECVVKGCTSKNMVCHRFPNENKDFARRLEWIKVVSFTVDDNPKFKNKYICSVHFADNCSSPGTKRLNANAYPTLNLPVGIPDGLVALPITVQAYNTELVTDNLIENRLNSVVCSTPKHDNILHDLHDISGFDFLNSTVDGKSDDVDDSTVMPQVIHVDGCAIGSEVRDGASLT